MKLTAKSAKGKHVDVRNACGILNLIASDPAEVIMLTRLYRHISGIEYSETTRRAIESLTTPLAPFTNGGPIAKLSDAREVAEESWIKH